MNVATAMVKSDSDSVPERPTSRRFVIRRAEGLWVLSDDEQKVGGIFLSLDVAHTYARREPAYVSGIARIVIVGETAALDERRAA